MGVAGGNAILNWGEENEDNDRRRTEDALAEVVSRGSIETDP
jgi:hypothetical protein